MALSADDLRNLHTGSVRDLDVMDAHGEGAADRAPASAPKGPSKTFGVNKFAGVCINCNARVEAEAGLRDKVDSKWVVFHRECPLVESPAATAEVPEGVDPERVAKLRAEAVKHGDPAIWDGDYTLITEGGHRTFNVETQAADANFAPGKTVISYLAGPDNTADFKGIGFVTGTAASPSIAVWKRVREAKSFEALNVDLALFLANVNGSIPRGDGDLGGFAVGTVLLAKKCIVCHRKLTNPDSITAGIGPWCAGL